VTGVVRLVRAEARTGADTRMGLVVAAGVALLLARPWLLPAGTGVGARVALFSVLGVAGVAWPLGQVEARRQGALSGSAVLAMGLGVVAFALGRVLGGPGPGVSGLGVAVTLNALAGVAEEAFFRRLAYGWLLQWGSGAAVVGSAVLFAVAHVTVWGLGVLPLDLAAGLVLSWQRAASGRWSVPAFTHVVANALALL
jgi:membrane protease YdiL (CAAX protease family)